MCLLERKPIMRILHAAYTCVKYNSFTDSSATHKRDKNFGGSKKKITQGLDVYLYSKANSTIGMIRQNIKSTLRANLKLLLDLSWNMSLPPSHHGWDGVY